MWAKMRSPATSSAGERDRRVLWLLLCSLSFLCVHFQLSTPRGSSLGQAASYFKFFFIHRPTADRGLSSPLSPPPPLLSVSRPASRLTTSCETEPHSGCAAECTLVLSLSPKTSVEANIKISDASKPTRARGGRTSPGVRFFLSHASYTKTRPPSQSGESRSSTTVRYVVPCMRVLWTGHVIIPKMYHGTHRAVFRRPLCSGLPLLGTFERLLVVCQKHLILVSGLSEIVCSAPGTGNLTKSHRPRTWNE